MTPAGALNIQFATKRISIAAEAAVLKRVADRFSHMPARHDATVVGELKVDTFDDGYRLTDGDQLLIADPVLTNVLENLVHAVAERFIKFSPELLWFHAAVVAHEGNAIMLPAMWGNGKSSLAVALANAGWTYLSDDIAPIDPVSNCVHPYPRIPTVRSDRGEKLPRERIAELPKTEVDSAGWSIATEPLPVSAIVFPKFRFQGATSMKTLNPEIAVVEILRHCLNFASGGKAAIEKMISLIPQLQTYQLTFGDANAAASMISAELRIPFPTAIGDAS